MKNVQNFSELQRFYDAHFFDIHSLSCYSDCSVISMGYGELGTVHEIMISLDGLTIAEHEFIVAYIAQQVFYFLTN
jgi:hypothetical protein